MLFLLRREGWELHPTSERQLSAIRLLLIPSLHEAASFEQTDRTLTNTEEARNRGSVPKPEAPLHAALVLVGGGQFFCREPSRIQLIGAHNETRLPLHLLFHAFLADADLSFEVPDGSDRSRPLTRSSPGRIAGLGHRLPLHLQPCG